MRPEYLLLLIVAATGAVAESSLETGGHAKLNLTAAAYPDDSLFRDLYGSDARDLAAEFRFNVHWRDARWSAALDYQLIGLLSDRLEAPVSLPLPGFGVLPDDGSRLADLTTSIDESRDAALVHRLDRLWIAYTSDAAVVRLGRQALSWGNGFFYTPMDLVNPFDPAAIDTEYKPGDDMFYAQLLRANGDDLQAAFVARRDPLSGDVESDRSALLVKYHGFAGESEYDLLAGRNYGERVIGMAISRAIGGAVASAEVIAADADGEVFVEFVTNLSYSWTAMGRNMTGVAEYHFNGTGQRAGRYAPDELAANTVLLDRVARGQAFALGRHYLAGSVSVEMTPLWQLSPLALVNLSDPSALLQLTSRLSLSDNATLLASLSVPVGPNGSEFGGIEVTTNGRFATIDAALFTQFAWYF